MSRRKQAKPRPIFAYEEDSAGNVAIEDVLVPISHTNGHRLADSVTEDDRDDVFREFVPLVMDTGPDDSPAVVQHSSAGGSNKLRSPSPSSIKLHKELPLPQASRLPRPEPLKASVMASLAMHLMTNNTPPSTALYHHDNRNSNTSTSSVASSFKERSFPITGTTFSTIVAGSLPGVSAASSSSGNSLNPSPVTMTTITPGTPSNPDDMSRGSTDAGSMIRRGSKTIEASSSSGNDENDENLEYDSDFDDLEEILSELIKHKILPVADEDGEKFICPVCSVSLLNLHDLTVHIRSHNTPASGTQSNSCKICGKVLSSQSSLDRHMLVHSGERPFICKVCNMSFTTNGNMHRHSRIHTKEENLKSLGAQFQMRRGKAAWRQRVNNFLNQQKLASPPPAIKTFQSSGVPVTMPKDILKNLPNHSQHSVFGRPDNAASLVVPQPTQQPQSGIHTAGVKRQFSGTELGSDWPVSVKRPALESGLDEDKGLSPRKLPSLQQQTPIKTEEMMEYTQQTEQCLDREDNKEVLHCPACPKTFLCKYGLESHLDSHPNLSGNLSCHCALCNLTFKNPRKLRLHRLIAHTEKSEKRSDSSSSDSGEASKSGPEAKVGFDDLTFVDFSVEKFSLIAKHYFEENVRASSSTYLNFVCKLCSKAFPCESSLILHTYTHSKEKCTQCPICECDYADVNEFHAHMLKHLSDKAFDDIRPSAKNEVGDDDVMPDRLTKHDFLAMFLLREEEEQNSEPRTSGAVLNTPKRESNRPIKQEKNQNNDYFAKLGQAFAQGIPPMFQHFPVFPPGYKPSLDDYHKMLQLATNMNMLPSMGAGLLKQGYPGQGHHGNQGHGNHTSPSKMPLNIPTPPSGTSTPKPAHYNCLALSGAPGLQGIRPTTPSKDQAVDIATLSGGPEREISQIKKMNSGLFPCKYCDGMFQDYKTLKDHIRTHQEPTPYQCNLCVYTSTDKSALIRHVRTHSGVHPYQCLDCNHAFTTWAACEGHIRRKHGKADRDDIENTVYLNKHALEFTSNRDGLHTPETVCKHCNVDFKYFRSLKNHLRSQETSHRKPFKCQLCEYPFCTKLNVLRHIQKAHPEINQVESFVVFENFPSEDDTADSQSSDDGIPLFSEDRSSSNSMLFQPPAAHSMSFSGHHESRHASPSKRQMSPLSHISPARSPLVKATAAAEERGCDTPLDFSMKQNCREPVKENGDSHMTGLMPGETPMDLSVRKVSSHIHIAPKPPSMDHYQCMSCPMGFSELSSLERHMRKSHEICLNDSTLASHLSGAIPVFNSEGKLLLPPKSMMAAAGGIPNYGYNVGKSMLGGRQNKPLLPKGKSVSATLQNLQDKLKQKREQTVGAPESDLASVSKMMNATDPLNFQAFFMPVQTTEIPQPVNTMTPNNLNRKTPTSSKFPNILKRPGIQISLEHCKAINRELDNLQREGDVDEAALSQVREMALSVKEEVVNSGPTPGYATGPGGMTLPTTTSPQLIMTSDIQTEDDNSEDGSCTSGQNADKGDGPPKKKRNSYADSPHKLACPYCPRAFPWVSSLTRHLLTHTGQKPFKCPRCPVTFSTKSNRERHLIRKHGVNMLDPLSRQTMDRPYKCPLCVFSSFSTQSNLLKHYRDRHNGANLPDNIADIERMSPSAIRAATMEMEIRAAENPPTADDASMGDEDDDLDNSVCSSEKMDEDSISYTEMDKADDSMSEKSERMSEKMSPSSVNAISSGEHTNSSMASVPEMDVPVKIAPHILMSMPPLQKMVRDVETEDEEPSADASPEKMETNHSVDMSVNQSMEHGLERMHSPSTMKRNIERIIAEQQRIIEQKAHMEMKIQSEIRAHIEAHRPLDNQSVSPVPASIDSMDSPKSFDPNKPFTGSAERIINPERDNYDVDKITECWKCKEMFPSRKSLVRHLKEHNIDLPFKCYLCDASYEIRVHCLNHQAAAHDSDWKILKEKNKVSDIEQFSVHMDKVVENNCNKLDSGSLLEIPGSGNDDSKMEVISADYMQRKVYCSLCPKRFWSLQDLRRHMRSHTGERPFECDICQKRFTLKHSMMRHRKKHVGAPPRSFDDEEDSNCGSDIAPRTSSSSSNKPSNSSRNLPSLYPYPSSLATMPSNQPSNAALSLANTFLFSQGLSGGQMILGGSNLGSLVHTSVASAASPKVAAVSQSQPSSSKEKPATTTSAPPKSASAKLDAVKKEFLNCDADMLHNLLGVDSSAIEKMLDSDVKATAKYLGVAEVS